MHVCDFRVPWIPLYIFMNGDSIIMAGNLYLSAAWSMFLLWGLVAFVISKWMFFKSVFGWNSWSYNRVPFRYSFSYMYLDLHVCYVLSCSCLQNIIQKINQTRNWVAHDLICLHKWGKTSVHSFKQNCQVLLY